MRHFLFSISFFAYAVLFMGTYRFGLPHTSLIIGGLLPGSVDDFAFILLLTFFIHLVFLLPVKVRYFILFPGIFLLQFIMMAEWWHYEFYRDYIHYASLGYIGSWRELLKGITGFQGRYLVLALSVFLLVILYMTGSLFRKKSSPGRAPVFFCIFFGLISLSLSGLISRVYAYSAIEHWQTKGQLPLEAKNPILELFREKFVVGNTIARVTNQHLDALQELYGHRIVREGQEERYPFYTDTVPTEGTTKKQLNVLFIVLESFRGYEVGEHDGFSLTPNFDRISKNNFTPKYFYSNSNQTIKAEIALLCGQHDFLVGTSISAYDMEFQTRCLPKIFQENGYNSFWFHGGYSSFYGRSTFFPKIGFNKMHDRAVIEDSLYASGHNYFIRHWGVEDPYVFDYTFEQLEKQKQPFFAEIMSLSSHHPFFDIENRWNMDDFPKEIKGDMTNMYRKYQHVTYYTDKALGQFWDKFSKSPLYDNTIVMIVGDHGIWLFPDGMEDHASEAQLYEAYTRLPLTIYFPGKHYSKEITTPLSQVDVPELIMAYMGLDKGTAFQSGLTHEESLSLINEQEVNKKLPDEKNMDELKSNPVFATIGDGYFFRKEDERCFPSIASKGGCNDYLFRCVKKYNVLREDEECFSWQGDILHKDAPVDAVKTDLTAANAVVDYFRNALFVGSGPIEPAKHEQIP